VILGAVLAGGRSSRFGSDKALAMLDDRTLLARAVERLASLCDAVVVVGRTQAPADTLPDWPAPGGGPLTGLAAALRHAEETGYGAVLSCGVDSIGLPDDLLERLSPSPRFVAEQPVVGLWPAASAKPLENLLMSDGKHSMRALADLVGATSIVLPQTIANINTPQDLAALKLSRTVER
jgi:molybdopterin-guanine dinucleotide biosynthesis protein A